MLHDLKHALRGLSQRRGFTLVAILTLSLGIGATTAIFSALYHTLLRPMPYEGGERMMYVWLKGGEMMITPRADHLDAWRGRTRSFEWTSEYNSGEYTLYGGAEPEIVAGMEIGRTLPALLDRQPILGRTFTEEEMQRNARRVVMLSEGMWQRRFGGRRDVLGEKLTIGEHSHEIVGVLPNRFGAFAGHGREPQLWLPLLPKETESERAMGASLLVKLRAEVDTVAATAELRALSQHVPQKGQMEWRPQVVSPSVFVDRTTKAGLPILFTAVAVVLLIACANIAGLLLVRVTARRRELAIRCAIGANRRRILRLLSAESLLLAVGGGVLGVLLAVWVLELIRSLRPETLNSLNAANLSGTTLWFAAGLSLVTAALFGAAPALAAVRRDLLQPLLSGAGGSSRVTGSNRLRAALVTAQIALSLVLLVGSLLLVRTVGQLQSRDVGFRPDGVLAMRINLPESSYPADVQRGAFYDALLPALRKIPGVQNVAQGTGVPTQPGVMFGSVSFEDRPLTGEEQPDLLYFTAATADYASALGMQLTEGRFATEPGEIVINESWAKQLWPNAGAVGRRMKLSDKPETEWDRIVGVARDVSTGTSATADHQQIFVPATYDWGGGWLVIQTNLEQPLGIVKQVRSAIASLDPRVVPRDVTTMTAMLSDTIAQQRFFMQLLTSFAALALLLSVIGLYGVISNAVAQRTAEIGVRLALGASPRTVQRMMLTQGSRLLAYGLVLGLAGSWASTRLIESTLYGVAATDPISYAGAVLLLSMATFAATWIPARRALRIDPLTALRAE